MTCIAYKVLVAEWQILVSNNYPEEAVIEQYWLALEHRFSCEVCRDETIVNGSFDLYRSVAPSLR